MRLCVEGVEYFKLLPLQGRKQRLLPTHYFHIVVMFPHELNFLVLQNKEVLFDLFFQATSQALGELALGYPRLKALLGFTAVLHTWNQDLLLHPHLHLVAPGGGSILPEIAGSVQKTTFSSPSKPAPKSSEANSSMPCKGLSTKETLLPRQHRWHKRGNGFPSFSQETKTSEMGPLF